MSYLNLTISLLPFVRRCFQAKVNKSRKLISIGLALCFCITLTLSFVCFASPSLDDATIEASVKAYFLKYTSSTTWLNNSLIQADGTIVTTQNFSLVSDFVPVSPLGTFCVVDATRGLSTVLKSYCFYDSEFNVVSGGSSSSNVNFIDIPFGVSFIRVTQSGSRSYVPLFCPTHFSSLNDKYLWGEIENLSITNGVVSIPYQSYSFTRVRLDVMFFDNNRDYDSVGISLRVDFADSQFYNGLVPFGTDDYIGYAFLDSISITDGDEYSYYANSSGASSTNNPCRLSTPCENGKFVGFRLMFPINSPSAEGAVSTGLSVTLSDFRLGDQSVAVEYGVVDMNKRLEHLAEGLAVPTPNINIGELLSEAFSGIDTTTTNNIFAIFYNNSLVPKMLLIAVSVGLVGFVLFGKRGHANE